MYPPVLEARFTKVLSVLARRKGGIIRWTLGEESGLLPVRLRQEREKMVKNEICCDLRLFFEDGVSKEFRNALCILIQVLIFSIVSICCRVILGFWRMKFKLLVFKPPEGVSLLLLLIFFSPDIAVSWNELESRNFGK